MGVDADSVQAIRYFERACRAGIAASCYAAAWIYQSMKDPALAAQRADYLEKVLHAYRTRDRRSSEMAAMSDGLSDDDIKGLAAHYARQKARAVVFVTVPGK